MMILSSGWRSAMRSTCGSEPGTDIIEGSVSRSATGQNQSAVPSVSHGRCDAEPKVKRKPSMPG